MDRQYTLCVLVPAHQYRNYVNNYHQQQQQQHHHQQQQQQHAQEQQHRNFQPPTYLQYQQQRLIQQRQQQQQQQEQIYENVVSQYRMRMCYHNDYENDEQIQRFYWEQCYKRNDTDATAYYYCEYVRTLIWITRLRNVSQVLVGSTSYCASLLSKDGNSVFLVVLFASKILVLVFI
ncbi:myb-like protein I [Monomorium pharaonis]|uniref:myb-like protein I n=1 Tax=Monomorium pharaonis TaxID=307658 RepID=UPI00174674CB|nr:myb-like protein I [Monomorium pharaonis]